MTGPNEYVLARGRAFCNFCPGYCCYRLPGASLLLDATDINRLARHFGLSDGEVRQRYLEGRNTFKTRADGSCILLANDRLCKRCTVHTARPLQCRAFPYDKPLRSSKSGRRLTWANLFQGHTSWQSSQP